MSAFSDARFRRLLIGSSISRFGDSALFLTLGVWTKDLSGSNAAAGCIFLAQGLTYLASPLSGHLVDRTSRRRVLIVANTATGATVLALLAVHSRHELWLMYVVAVGYGLGATVISPASAGLIKDLLPEQDLATANAAIVTTGQGLRIISPLVGTALYAGLGGASVAILDSLSFLAAIAAVASVRVVESPVSERQRQSLQTDLLAGFRHMRRTRLLRQITVATATAMLVLGFYESVTFAVIAAMGRSPAFFGVLMSVQAAGSIVGGVAAGRCIRRFGEARLLGAALVLWSVASVVYTAADVVTSCAALFGFGVAVSFCAISVGTATQRCTPPRLLGRVSAASDMALGLTQSTSIAIGASLVDRVGYQPLLLVVAIVAALAATPVLIRPARLGPSQCPPGRMNTVDSITELADADAAPPVR